MINAANAATEAALFAGGCFWCEQEVFDDLPGVIATTVGFTGGHTKNPTYNQVSHGNTGHLECVQVIFDPQIISYEQLLEAFWRSVDPFDPDGQFCDKGNSYKSAIFFTNEDQHIKAKTSKQRYEASFGKPIETTIRTASTFYPAEDYHQNYAKNNPIRYHFYRWNCGRDARLAEVWGSETRTQEPGSRNF